VQTQPGLEGVALAEVGGRFAAAAKRPPTSAELDEARARPLPRRTPGARFREIGRRIVADRAGLAIFHASSVEPLTTLRASEDLFALVGYGGEVAHDRHALDRIRAIARDAPYLENALIHRVRMQPRARSGRRLKFRVVARMSGLQEFRRAEFKRAVERGISERSDRSWLCVDEGGDVEFWASLLDDELLLTLRLSDQSMRQRDYKAAHIPGSLRPAVAAAMGLLSEPSSDDLVLDPFCGAGTILIERAHLARYQSLIGGDSDENALNAARSNIGSRYKPIELNIWNAASIPLPDRSVSRIITNLPWGMQHGSHAENRRLYPQVFAEFTRLIRDGGRIVLLSGETRLMNELLRSGPLRAEKTLHVSILGARAAIYMCQRRPAA
jgi:hypothetical protein